MRCPLLLLIGIALWVGAKPAACETPPLSKEELRRFESFVLSEMEARRIPGMSVAFSNGDFEWAKGFGYADLENRVPAGTKSAYRLASVTKTMTAVAILSLAVEGKLDLDAEVQKYVEYFPNKAQPITIRQLLGHLGGISHYRNYAEEGHFKTHYDTRASLEVFMDWALVSPPGSKFNYTSYGYNLLGAVIEGASGKSFGETLAERIWDPLGMDDTRLDSPDDLIPHRVRGYRIFGGEVKNSEFVDISSRFAAGGTRSTVLDLIKYSRGLDRGEILSVEAQAEMYDPMQTSDGTSTGYGMGWGVGSHCGFWRVSHSGGQAETSTYLLRFPRENLAIAVASNLEGAPCSRIAFNLASRVLGVAPVETITQSPSDEVVLDAMRRTWSDGLSRVNRFGFQKNDDEAVTASFELLEDVLELSEAPEKLDGVRAKIRAGSQPSGGALWSVLGAHMARTIASSLGDDSDSSLDGLRSGGPLEFFRAYVDRVPSDSKLPKAHRLDPGFASRVQRWSDGWRKVWNEEARSIALGSASNLEKLAERLPILLADSPILPRFAAKISQHAMHLAQEGRGKKAIECLSAAAQAYGFDPALWIQLGHLWISEENYPSARTSFEKALALNSQPSSVQKALAFVETAEKRVALSSATASRLVGEYWFEAIGSSVRIAAEKDRLLAFPPDSPPVALVPLSTSRFVLWDPDDGESLQLEFEFGEESRVTSLRVSRSGRVMKGEPIRKP